MLGTKNFGFPEAILPIADEATDLISSLGDEIKA